ncbi:MAG TPA: hypothetical protein ENN03_05275 [bacterium]|nr:hypothetical protein [bacterium]
MEEVLTRNRSFKFWEWVVFILLMGMCIPFILVYSDSVAITVVRRVDEYEIVTNVRNMISWIFSGQINMAASRTSALGYGPTYWGVCTLILMPVYALFQEPGLIIGFRLLTVGLTVSSFILLAWILKSIGTSRLVTMVIVLVGFLAPVHIEYTTFVHPESMYIFLLMLSLVFIVKDAEGYSKGFAWSVLFFVLAVAMKLNAVFFGLFHLVYLAFNREKITVRNIFLWLGGGLCLYLLLHLPLFLKPVMLQRHLSFLSGMRTTVKLGPHLEETPGINLTPFSRQYVNLAVFSLILAGSIAYLFLGNVRKRWSLQRVLTLGSLLVMSIYFYFQNIYIRFGHIHYSFVMLFVFPLLAAAAFSTIKALVTRKKYQLSAVLIGLIIFLGLSLPNMIRSLDYLYHVQGNPIHQHRARVIRLIGEFINDYEGPVEHVGICQNVTVPHRHGKRVNQTRFRHFSDDYVSIFDLMIFWKHDRFHKYYVEDFARWKDTRKTYRKIESGEKMRSNDGLIFSFEKILDDEELIIYRRIVHEAPNHD